MRVSHSFRVWFHIFSTRFECSFHIFSTRFECSFHIFSTLFACSFHIFSTRFECSFNIFSTRFECSFRFLTTMFWSHILKPNTSVKLTEEELLGQMLHLSQVKIYTRNEWRRCENLHSKRVEKMWKFTLETSGEDLKSTLETSVFFPETGLPRFNFQRQSSPKDSSDYGGGWKQEKRVCYRCVSKWKNWKRELRHVFRARRRGESFPLVSSVVFTSFPLVSSVFFISSPLVSGVVLPSLHSFRVYFSDLLHSFRV